MSDQQTEEEPENKGKGSVRNLVIAVVVVVVVFALTIGLMFIKSRRDFETTDMGNSFKIIEEDKYFFNGFSFIKMSDNLWYTQVTKDNKLFTLPMRYGPLEIEEIPVEEGVTEKIVNSSYVYLTVAPDVSSQYVMAMVEIGKVLGTKYQIYNMDVKSAFTFSPENAIGAQQPIVTCDNATSSTRVVWFKKASPTIAYVEGDCVILQSDEDMGIVMLTDRIVYDLVNII